MINESKPSFLDTPLVAALKLDVEKGLYILFTLAAIFTRFWRLGDRVLSHDESLHAYFSWGLYMGRGFQHTPLMHGPFLFHINALIYSLFGADDFTARISPALFGAALVLLPWTLRRWLGRVGALVVSFMFLISPMILFHARYIRDESYDLAWVTLTLWAVFVYLRDRKEKWLYLLAAVSALFFTTMEVSFIYTSIFASFLAMLAAIDIAREHGWGWDGLTRLLTAVASVAALLSIGVSIVYAILVTRGLGPVSAAAAGETAAPVLANLDVAINLILLSVVGIFCGLAAFGVLRYLLPDSIRVSPAFDLAMVFVVFYLPVASPLAIKLAGFDPMDYGAAGIVRAGGIFVPFLAVSIALGLWWNWKRFLILGGIWYGITITLFTTVFTNGAGLATGMIGSLGYWIAQQAVQRGSQPWYYYGLLVPLYEYLPLIVSTLAIVIYVARGFRFPVHIYKPEAKPEAQDLEREHSLFTLFLVYWIVLTWVAFSYAGEKMPWLTTYFALPMILLSGHFLGRWFERLNWKRTVQGWPVAILTPLFVIAFGGMLAAISAGAFQGKELAQLTASGQWFSAFIVAIGALIGLAVVWPRIGWQISVRILALEALTLLTLLTIRTAWRWSYINYDYPVEFGVYAHGGSGVKIAQAQIDDISQRIAGDHTLKVAYDSDSSWPFSWYLRDYTNAVYVPNNPTRDQLNAPVVLAGSASWSTFEAILGDRYDKFTYKLIWWPMEDYKGKSGKTLSIQEVTWALADPQMRLALWDIWLNRDYKLYDQVTGETHTPDKWPLVHDFRLYVRKDISAMMWDQHIGPAPVASPQVDPYAKGRRDAVGQVIGSAGNLLGQFNAPHGMAIAPDGSLYVADSNNHRIQKFDSDGKPVLTIGSYSGANNTNPAPGTFNEPWGVAVGPDGSVYVADTWNHRIQKFDPSGKFLTMWGSAGQTDANAGGQPNVFWGPRDVAVDKEGRVYVTDTGNKRIQVFDSDGAFIAQFGGAGVQPGQLDEPVGLAVASDGNLVVDDTWNQRIQILTPDGNPVRQWQVEGWLDQSVTDKPYVAVDKNGNIYTVDPTGFRVLVFGPDGTFKATFGDIGTDDKSFQLPIGIAVDENGNVYVSDASLNRILRFNAADLNIK